MSVDDIDREPLEPFEQFAEALREEVRSRCEASTEVDVDLADALIAAQNLIAACDGQ